MRIDIHAHVWSTDYLDLIESMGNTETQAYRSLGAGTTPAELERRFAMLDAAGIDMQVLMAAPLSPHFGDEDSAIKAARRVNDEYAALIARHPARFAAFASLPLPHIDASLAELDRALAQLRMPGVCITSSVLGLALSDERFVPLYDEFDRRGAILFVHPAGAGAGSPLIAGHRLTWSIGAPVEDTIAAMHLILAGIPMRYPNLRIVIPHLGGLMPMILNRVDQTVRWEAPGIPEEPSLAARRLRYDTVGHGDVPGLQAAAAAFGADRLLFGTDFPFQPGEHFARTVSYVREAGLPDHDVSSILDRNAGELIFAGVER